MLEQTILNNIYKGNIKNKENISWFVDYMKNNLVLFLKTEDENLKVTLVSLFQVDIFE